MKLTLSIVSSIVFIFSSQGLCASSTLFSQRVSLISACNQNKPDKEQQLNDAIKSDNPVIRRTAARLLAQQGQMGLEILKKQVGMNGDVLTDRIVLFELFRQTSDYSYARLGLKSDDPITRYIFALYMEKDSTKPDDIIGVLRLLEKDASQKVRETATRSGWPLHKDNITVGERKDLDYDVKVTNAIPIDNAGWKFCLDPNNQGYTLGWFESDYDASKWDDISIGSSWEGAGYNYDGIAWYRKNFRISKPLKYIAVELDFKGVDECAWVWLNGVYIGQHDIGSIGWDKPFQLDITKEILWDRDNIIVVRVMDTEWVGGIYKPIEIKIYEITF